MGGIRWLVNDLAAHFIFYTRYNNVYGLVHKHCKLIRSCDRYGSRANRRITSVDGMKMAQSGNS